MSGDFQIMIQVSYLQRMIEASISRLEYYLYLFSTIKNF